MKIVRMCLCAYVLLCQTAWAHEWKKIEPGLNYKKAGPIHVFQIDPKRYRFSVATAPEHGLINATVKALAQKAKAVMAINGGFFSPEQKSIGLLLREGKTINPLHPTPWWSVFYILDQKPFIVLSDTFRKNLKMRPRSGREGEAPVALPLEGATRAPIIEMALQAGPRLIVKGKIPKFNPSLAHRSGVGIQKEGNIIFAVSEKELSMESFAGFLSDLDCSDALNLDGGGSTQIYFNRNGFKLHIPGPSLITNAITVFPRNW